MSYMSDISVYLHVKMIYGRFVGENPEASGPNSTHARHS